MREAGARLEPSPAEERGINSRKSRDHRTLIPGGSTAEHQALGSTSGHSGTASPAPACTGRTCPSPHPTGSCSSLRSLFFGPSIPEEELGEGWCCAGPPWLVPTPRFLLPSPAPARRCPGTRGPAGSVPPGVPGSVPAASVWDDVTPAAVASEGSRLGMSPSPGRTCGPVGQGPVLILSLLRPRAQHELPPPCPIPAPLGFWDGADQPRAVTATRPAGWRAGEVAEDARMGNPRLECCLRRSCLAHHPLSITPLRHHRLPQVRGISRAVRSAGKTGGGREMFVSEKEYSIFFYLRSCKSPGSSTVGAPAGNPRRRGEIPAGSSLRRHPQGGGTEGGQSSAL